MMQGYVSGDVYVTLPLNETEYETYFQTDSLSFARALDMALDNKRRIPVQFLKENYKEEIFDLYEKADDTSAVDLDAAGLMFKYPVIMQSGVSTRINDMEFFVNFSNLSKVGRDIILDTALYHPDDRYLEFYLDKDEYALIKTAYSYINEENKKIYEILYDEIKSLGDVNAIDKVFVTLANIDNDTKYFQNAVELGEYYVEEFGMDDNFISYEQVGYDILDKNLFFADELYFTDKGIVAIPELDIEKGYLLKEQVMENLENKIEYDER